MSRQETYPKIADVIPRKGRELLVRFRNGATRLYDCTPLLEKSAFQSLRNEAFFRRARADSHGYGVIWSDDVDLAESEVWLRGRPVATRDAMVCESGAAELPAKAAAKGRRSAVKYPTVRKLNRSGRGK